MLCILRLCLLVALFGVTAGSHADECAIVHKDTAVQRELYLDTSNKNCLVLELSETLNSVAVAMLPDKPAPYALRVLHRQNNGLSTVSTHMAESDGMLVANLIPNGRTFAVVPMLNVTDQKRRVVFLQYTVKDKVGYVVFRVQEL